MTTTTQLTAKLVILLAFSGWAIQVWAQSSGIRYVIRHIDTEAGLMHTDAPSVLQGEDGFMWFATLAGLQRYDGFECRTYLNNQDPPNRAYLNRIRQLRKDVQGRIWMTTYGGLTCFDPKTESFLDLKLGSSLDPDLLEEAKDVFLDSQNRLFVCARGKTWAFQIQADGRLKPAEGLASSGLFFEFQIHDLVEDSRGDLWMARINQLWHLPRNRSFDQAQKYSLKDFGTREKGRNFLHRLAMDSEGNLIISTPGQLLKLDLHAFHKGGKVLSTGLPLAVIELDKLKEDCSQDDLPANLEIHALAVDKHNNYWLGTSHGLIKMRFDPTGAWNDFQCFQHSQTDPTSLSSNHITSVYIDDHGGLWMGTWGGGVNVLNLEQKKFYLLRHLAWSPEQGLSGPFVRAVWEDEKSGELWIGTREAGLTHYNPRNGSFTHYRHDPADPTSLMNDNLRTLVQDQEQRLWIGTDRGLCYLDLKDKTFHRPFRDYPALAAKNFFGLAVDHAGQIWAGTWQGGGLYRIRMQGNEVAEVEEINSINQAHLTSPNITFIRADQARKEVWISTQEGLNQLKLDSRGYPQELRTYQVHTDQAQSLSSNFIWPTLRENDSIIWVGTLGGGLNRMVISASYKPGEMNYRAEAYDVTQGAPFNDVEILLQDQEQNLWLGGRGLAKFIPRQREFLLYDESDGLQSNSFKIGAGFTGQDGRMYFGGIKGLTYFDPTQIRSNSVQVATGLAHLVVNNRRVEVGEDYDQTIILSQNLNQTEQITLRHDQNNFSLQFASLHFTNPEKCKFRYRLKGYDEHWVYVNADAPYAAYSNLDYGNYVFELVASNSDGIWSHSSQSLTISIVPPWYATWWAKLGYILLGLGVCMGIFFYLRRWQLMKRDLQMTRLEEEQKEAMHQMRLQFFTNISHEFRTPLSLILSPLEKMAEKPMGRIELQRHIKLITDNANRLLRLVNELLDFRRLESDQVRLRIAEADLSSFARSVGERFEELAESKAVQYDIEVPSSRVLACYDAEVLENILYNLLSNSFKYTSLNGSVKLSVSLDPPKGSRLYTNRMSIGVAAPSERYLYLRTVDTGVGITQDSIEHVFDRYYRVSDSPQDQHLGSGIGLALVKSLVELHKGDIEVRSERGRGTEFLVRLPIDAACYEREEWAIQAGETFASVQLLPIVENQSLPVLNEKEGQGFLPKILLVEDNAPVRQYLAESLSGEYEIIEAENGKQGLEKVHTLMPDLIISDIMMPEMDGIAFCKAVKGSEKLSHIPIALLTARSSLTSQIDGLSAGADLYFSKPFNLKLIRLNLANLLSQRARMRERNIQAAFTDQHQQARNERDQELFDQIVKVIDDRMEENNFDVETLCRAVGMSRTNLYAKMKEISGHTIGEFIRKRRLHHAAILLSEGNLTVLEVMDRVGIRSQSYFTRAFKKEYGKTPSQFVQNIVNQNGAVSVGA